ncbi:hypothetical protein ABZ543_34715 [Streptomyces roseifaciens]
MHNEISGGRFHTVVQGHRVEVHFTSPRPEEQQARGRAGRALLAVACAALGLALFLAPPPAARGFASLGAALAVIGLVWGAAVLWGLPERWQGRRAPRRGPLPEELDRVAEDLAAALAGEYARDERQSRIHDPVPIPVRWSAADPQVSDHEANIMGAPATTDPAPAPAPDRDGRFDAIGRFFTSLPNGRLVILGAPGAGKSALALRLARALLDDRVPLTAVPVLLPLASWNPTEQDPWHWAARRLAALHPSAVPTHHTAHDLSACVESRPSSLQKQVIHAAADFVEDGGGGSRHGLESKIPALVGGGAGRECCGDRCADSLRLSAHAVGPAARAAVGAGVVERAVSEANDRGGIGWC